jgi:hypothetical protein
MPVLTTIFDKIMILEIDLKAICLLQYLLLF